MTLERLPNAGGADARTADKAAQQRTEAMSRGDCVAKHGGKGRVVNASETAALLAAGAKDER